MSRKLGIFITIIILLVSLDVFLFYKASKDTYMQEREYKCKVISKIDNQYNTTIRGNEHYNRDFILILYSEGKTFSLDVTPTVWAIHKEGDIIYFRIAPYQLDYYEAVPMRWFLWSCIITAISVSIIIISAICLFYKEGA
jgi:hypothetical protein